MPEQRGDESPITTLIEGLTHLCLNKDPCNMKEVHEELYTRILSTPVEEIPSLLDMVPDPGLIGELLGLDHQDTTLLMQVEEIDKIADLYFFQYVYQDDNWSLPHPATLQSIFHEIQQTEGGNMNHIAGLIHGDSAASMHNAALFGFRVLNFFESDKCKEMFPHLKFDPHNLDIPSFTVLVVAMLSMYTAVAYGDYDWEFYALSADEVEEYERRGRPRSRSF
ncbi:hypothetical protein GGR54DRAFT_641267 [Hypoxylon sp. NC1633]|nr:hypothetical protein GGR54DRAFT_641267 [Hypoxylon sp. NC1633]